MSDTSCEILSLTAEPAVMAQRGIITFANSGAICIFGTECIGKKPAEVFGSDLLDYQSQSCVAGISAGGRTYILRMSTVGSRQIFLFTPQAESFDMVNDAFLYSLRSNMSAFSLANEKAVALAEGYALPELYEPLKTMTRSYYRISRLVRNISVVHNAVFGTLPCSERAFDLCELCSATAESLSRICPDDEVSFSCSGAVCVKGDPELTELMFLNVLSNALIHAKGRSRIRVSLRKAGETALLYVNDDGCGIPSDTLSKVFERYRYGFGLSEIGGGAGFGLSAALHIAMCHGGTVLLESREGVGTTVCISMQCGDDKSVGSIEPYEPKMENLLTGFADYIPESCFGADYTS